VTAFDANHIARSIPIFRDLSTIETVFNKIKVVRAWDSRLHVVTGVPPHIKEFVDLEALRQEHSELTNKVYQKVMNGLWEYFEVRKIGGGQLTEAQIREMIAEGCRQTAEDLANRIKVKLDLLASSFEESTGSGGRVALQRNGRPQQRETCRIRTNTLGQLTRLPDDFQFPKGNAFDCWNQWNIGNKERQIPPLRLVDVTKYRFLDLKNKSDEEKRGQRGIHINNRRPSRKIYSDMKFLCNYIEQKASDAGLDTLDRSLGNMRSMFEAAENDIRSGSESRRRIDQLKWQTFVARLRRKISRERASIT
jgi:hypothetical protein